MLIKMLEIFTRHFEINFYSMFLKNLNTNLLNLIYLLTHFFSSFKWLSSNYPVTYAKMFSHFVYFKFLFYMSVISIRKKKFSKFVPKYYL